MPNIKSAKKRVLVSKARNERNRAARSELRTTIKKFDTAINSDDADKAAVFNATVSSVYKAAAKGIMHKNAAARKKSQLARKLNATKQA